MTKTSRTDANRASAFWGLSLDGHLYNAFTGDTCDVTDHSRGQFTVHSGSGKNYHVDTRSVTCSCPDFQKRGRQCKHQAAVTAFRSIEAGYRPAKPRFRLKGQTIIPVTPPGYPTSAERLAAMNAAIFGPEA